MANNDDFYLSLSGEVIDALLLMLHKAKIKQAELETVVGVTAGVATGGKAIVADAQKSISGLLSFSSTTLLASYLNLQPAPEPTKPSQGLILWLTAEAKIYTKDSAGVVKELSTGGSGTGASVLFNGDREVTREGVPNVNPGGTTLTEFLENYFYPPVNPLIEGAFQSPLMVVGAVSSNTLSFSVTKRTYGIVNLDVELSDQSTISISIPPLLQQDTTVYGSKFNFTVPIPVTGSVSVTATIKATTTSGGTTSKAINYASVYPALVAALDVNTIVQGTIYQSSDKYVVPVGAEFDIPLNLAGKYLVIGVPATILETAYLRDPHGNIIQLDSLVQLVDSKQLFSNWTTSYKFYYTDVPVIIESETYTLIYDAN